MTYDPGFYEVIRPGCQASAAVVVPIVEDLIGTPETVIDVGCGEGWWGAAFAELGSSVTGIDGLWVPTPAIDLVRIDISAEPLPDLPRAELVVCLEVAEHLPVARAAGFIHELCALGDVVLFSAAIPGQSGAGHVNCRWPAYWAQLFADEGYGVDDTLRWEIWDRSEVEPWYRQNLLVFCRSWPIAEPPPAVVHPDIWAWR